MRSLIRTALRSADRILAWVGRRLVNTLPSTAPRSHRVLFGIVAAGLLATVPPAAPLCTGDAGEYLLMIESFHRHGTPDLQPGDLESLARLGGLSLGLDNRHILSAYFTDRTGALYSYHFWGYPLLALPARALLRLVHVNGLRAPQMTNLLVFLLALRQVLFRAPFEPRRRLALFLLLLLSPIVWFLRWAQPEVLVFSMVTIALVALYRGQPTAPILPAAVASLQSPPLVVLVFVLWVQAVRRQGAGWRRVWLPSALALVALVPPIFYYWRFGTPSLIADEATSLDLLSAWRTLELAVDLNIGLLPYLPLTVVLFLMLAVPGAVLRARRAPREAVLLGVLGLGALATTVTANWNHGTIGPSRYALWLLPIMVLLVIQAQASIVRWGRLTGALLVAAVLIQAVIVVSRGGIAVMPDYLEHSYAARFVLRYAPGLYNPSHEIFRIRTTHDFFASRGPYVYRDDTGCRKALVTRRHGRALARACGQVPPGYESFFAGETGPEWRYVNY